MDQTLRYRIEFEDAQALRASGETNAALDRIGATAEAAGRRGSHGLDSMGARMMASVFGANVLYAAFNRVVQIAKEFTVSAATYAARTETMGVVTAQLARANQMNQQAVLAQVEAVKRLGIVSTEAHGVLQKMIFAELDIAKATNLARVAQDAAVIAGINSSEALENIIIGITTGMTRILHHMGLQVSLEQVITEGERRLGRAMTEREKRAGMLNKVIQEGTKIHGAYEAAMETAGKQMTTLVRFVNEAKNALGAQFQPILKASIRLVEGLTTNVRENASAWATGVKTLAASAAAWGAYALGIKAFGATIGALGGWATLLGFGAIAVTLLQLDELQQRYDKFFKDTLKASEDFVARLQPMLQSIREGKPAEELAPMISDIMRQAVAAGYKEPIKGLWSMEGFNLPSIRNEAFVEFVKQRYKLDPDQLDALRAHGGKLGQMVWQAVAEGWEKFGKFERPTIGGKPISVIMPEIEDPAAAKRLADQITKHRADALARSREMAAESAAATKEGLLRIVAESRLELSKMTSFVDEKGRIQRFRLDAETVANMQRYSFNKVLGAGREDQKKHLAEHLRDVQAASDAEMKYQAETFGRENEQRASMLERAQATDEDRVRQAFEGEQLGLERSRDGELRKLELVSARTVEAKLAVEARKLQIELNYLERSKRITLAKIEFERALAHAELVKATPAAMLSSPEFRGAVTAIDDLFRERRVAAQQAADAAGVEATQRTEIAKTQIIKDENQRVFDWLKQSAGGVFDALLVKASSVWAAIGNVFKTAMLTAIKEVVTSQIALMFMRLMGAAQGGGLGRLAGAFGLGGGVTILGAGSMVGGPGGTPGFAGPVKMATGGLGGIGGIGGWAGLLRAWPMLAALGGGLTMLGGITRGGGSGAAMSVAGGALLGTQLMVHGTLLGMLGGGGLGLAAAGIARGGLGGMLMAAGGGGLLGWRLGGPLGAAIGAGAGFLAAGLRTLFGGKSPEQRLRDKIREVWKVEVKDKAFLGSLLDLVRQRYGGSIDVGVRSPEVRELVMLYAETTGQRAARDLSAQPFRLAQAGGQLYQQATYLGGQAYAWESALPTLSPGGAIDRIAPGVFAGTSTVVLQLDAQATQDLLEGRAAEAVGKNPRLVSAAASEGLASNAGRRGMQARLMRPNTIFG